MQLNITFSASEIIRPILVAAYLLACFSSLETISYHRKCFEDSKQSKHLEIERIPPNKKKKKDFCYDFNDGMISIR